MGKKQSDFKHCRRIEKKAKGLEKYLFHVFPSTG